MRAPQILVVFLLLSLLVVLSAEARATLDVSVPLARAFSSTLRFVRVDRGCKIVDKDESAAFVVFECGEGKISRGNVELFVSADGKNVRVQVGLPDEPHYSELRFIELLERKLKEEYGSTKPLPPHAPPAPAKPAPDGGTP